MASQIGSRYEIFIRESSEIHHGHLKDDFWICRGLWHRHQGEYETAVADMTRAIELESKNGGSLWLGQAHSNRSMVYFQLKSWEDVVKDIDEAERLGVSWTWMYRNRGNAHLNLNHIDEAIADAQQVVGMDPSDVFHRNLLVKADRAREQPQQLAESYASLLNKHDAWCNLGIAYLPNGDPQKAVNCFEKASALDPYQRKGHMQWARALWRVERRTEARQKFIEGVAWMEANASEDETQLRFRAGAEKLMGIDGQQRAEMIAEYYSGPAPANATADYWKERGRRHHDKREYEQSVADFTQAIQLEAGNADAYARRGAALVKLKRWDEALSDLDEAIRINPSDVWAHIGRSDSNRNLKHLDEE